MHKLKSIQENVVFAVMNAIKLHVLRCKKSSVPIVEKCLVDKVREPKKLTFARVLVLHSIIIISTQNGRVAITVKTAAKNSLVITKDAVDAAVCTLLIFLVNVLSQRHS